MRCRVVPILAVLVAPAAAAGDRVAPGTRGEALLIKNCANCHAIGRTGASPDRNAPPFRILGRRYPVESLEEALAEGIISSHPDMDEPAFDSEDVGAIISYLKSIQVP